MNNCVGEKNQKYFLLFLLYIFLCTAYSWAVIGLRMRHCWNFGTRACRMPHNELPQLVVSLIMLFVALLFGLFVLVMGADQLNGIRKNQTGIDRLKGLSHQDQSTFCQRFAQVFGGGKFTRSWLLPITPTRREASWDP